MNNNIVRKNLAIGPLFLLTVVIPTIISFVYFEIGSSDVYISEAKFVVRSPEKPTGTGLGILLKSAGFSAAGDEMFAAQDYVVSRDALIALNHNNDFTKAYSSTDISVFDRFSTYFSGNSFEDLYKYYKKKITVNYDNASSIATLTVRAYSPRDALRFNERLLEIAEATVNRMNNRGRQDLVRYAVREADDAKRKATDAALALAKYRNREGVVDPEKQAEVQLQMVSKLQDELIATRTQLLELQSFTPQNPQIEVLRVRVNGLAKEIDRQLGQVAGGGKSLAATAVQYQRLYLENEFASRQLAAAMASLEEARNEARRKQAYVERIVQPNLPDEALEPRRLRGVAATFALGLVAWAILKMLFVGIKEHGG